MESKFGRKYFPIIITGESGIGKTKLAKELSLNPIFEDVTILSSQGDVFIEQGSASIVYLTKDNYEKTKDFLIKKYSSNIIK